jgi:hypothetical protein
VHSLGLRYSDGLPCTAPTRSQALEGNADDLTARLDDRATRVARVDGSINLEGQEGGAAMRVLHTAWASNRQVSEKC